MGRRQLRDYKENRIRRIGVPPAGYAGYFFAAVLNSFLYPAYHAAAKLRSCLSCFFHGLMKTLRQNRVILILFSLLTFVSLERFCHYQTGGFRFYKLISPRQDEGVEETDLEIVSQVAEKPLKYLGTGNQFYVFASADGKYVIKFIKHSWKDHVFKNREKRFQDIVKSCNLGFHQLAKETGIVTCSFTRKKLPEATLIDKLGIAHKIDLRKTEFIIQKKVSPFAGPLTQEKIRSLIHLVTRQCQKNIVNLDPMIDRNFGFCNNEAVLIDFGSLKYDATRRVDREIFLELLGLREWLQNNQPELVSHFDQEITQVLF